MIEFNFSELTDFDKNFLKRVSNEFPKESKKFMGRAGNAFRRQVRSEYRSTVKKKTGNLLKGIGRGRPYIWAGNEFQVRVYNKAPHAHLIEYGHKMVDWRTGEQTKKTEFVSGKHIVGKVAQAFPGEFDNLCDKFVDDLLERGFY